MKMEKKGRLQDVTPFKVMSFREAAHALGWSITEDEESFYCTCDCDKSTIMYNGFFGIEVVECENCGKSMTNLFSPIQTSNSTAAILDFKNYELEQDADGYDRFWIADDGKGGVKNG